jgi:hypothetical protein
VSYLCLRIRVSLDQDRCPVSVYCLQVLLAPVFALVLCVYFSLSLSLTSLALAFLSLTSLVLASLPVLALAFLVLALAFPTLASFSLASLALAFLVALA